MGSKDTVKDDMGSKDTVKDDMGSKDTVNKHFDVFENLRNGINKFR